MALPPSSGAGSSAASEAALKLDDTVMSGLRVAAAFRDPRDQALRSVDLHATELLAVVVSEGDSIRLYDIDKRQYVVLRCKSIGRGGARACACRHPCHVCVRLPCVGLD